MERFKFSLGDRIKLAQTDEVGEVIGRAEYAHGNENSYWVRFKAANGCQSERWWQESALVAFA